MFSVTDNFWQFKISFVCVFFQHVDNRLPVNRF